ncbi:MAG: DNA-binding response regulator, partial [Candidatus Nanopelagicales bacterium]
MARLLLLTHAVQPSAEVLPALGLLSHSVRVAPAEAA